MIGTERPMAAKEKKRPGPIEQVTWASTTRIAGSCGMPRERSSVLWRLPRHTGRKRAEEELLFKTAVLGPIGSCARWSLVVDPSGRVLRANRRFRGMMGPAAGTRSRGRIAGCWSLS